MIAPHTGQSDAHPLSTVPDRVDAEELARRLEAVATEVQSRSPSLAAMARLREQLAELSDRVAWVADDSARKHLANRVADLLKWIG